MSKLKVQRPIQERRVILGNLSYLINEKDKTATIIGYKRSSSEIIIPRSVNIQSREYVISSIGPNSFAKLNSKTIKISEDSEIRTIENNAFAGSSIEKFTIPPHLTKICEKSFAFCQKLRTIEIPPNCELETIEKNAFTQTRIESFTIPASLVNLQDEWFADAFHLSKIDVDPKNPVFKSFDDNQIIIGKSSIESENFDRLVFSVRNIEKLKIPSFIKHISPFAFSFCVKLQSIEIPKNSQLQTIEKGAFLNSGIEKFTIPPNLTKICEKAFYSCNNLREFEVPPESELNTIESDAFNGTGFECIQIPSTLIDLKEGWCNGTLKIKEIKVSIDHPLYKTYDNGKFVIGKSSIESENFDILIFCARNIETKVMIPSFIKQIGPYAFNMCQKIKKVEFQDDSELQTIEKGAFSKSSIETITIPQFVTEIKENAFDECKKIKTVQFSNNSKLQIICDNAFACSSIEKFTIPSNTTEICKNSFFFCSKLKKIDFQPNSKLKKIGYEAFQSSSITCFSVPPSVVQIDRYAFACKNLKIIEFDKNSKIESIHHELFEYSSPLLVMIPMELISIIK